MKEEKVLKLDEVIEKGLETLSLIELGTDASEAVIDDLVKLHNLKMENLKMGEELTDRDMNRDVIVQQVEEREKDRKIRLCLDSASIIVPMMFYGYWMRKGFIFEQTGTYTSKTFTNLMNRLRPSKG